MVFNSGGELFFSSVLLLTTNSRGILQEEIMTCNKLLILLDKLSVFSAGSAYLYAHSKDPICLNPFKKE